MKTCTLYQLAQHSHIQMMSYVILTPEKELVVIDGGTRTDAAYLLEVLRDVSGEEKPHISAWFLTHAHLDHVDAFLEMFEKHSVEFTLDTLYHHFPAPEFIKAYEPSSYPTIEALAKLLPKLGEKVRIVETGNRIDISGASFEVLYTTDPAFTGNALNNSSTVLRMESAGVSVLFLGDLGLEGGQKLLDTLPASKLKADIVQLSHHGQSGVDLPVYRAVSPSLAMWCTPFWLWENNQGNRGSGSGPWRIDETRGWMDECGVHSHIITMDGTYKVTLENEEYTISLYDSYAAN